MSKKIQLFLVNNIIWVINIVMFALFLTAESKLIMPKNIISMVYSVAMLGMLIYAQGVVLISGNFDMSVGAIAGFSATIAAVVYDKWIPGAPWYVLLLFALITGAIIGLYNGLLIGRVNINPFLQTLGSYVLFYGLMLIVAGQTQFNLPESYFVFGGGFIGETGIPVAVIILIAITALLYLLLNKSTLGRQIYAVGSNRLAAKTCGVDVKSTLVKVFVISGILSAMAGVLYTGYMKCVPMDMAEPDLFMTFAGAILGGVAIQGGSGKVSGIFGGIIFLGIMEIGLTMLKSPATWRGAITGVILTLAVILNTYQTRLKARILAKESVKGQIAKGQKAA